MNPSNQSELGKLVSPQPPTAEDSLAQNEELELTPTQHNKLLIRQFLRHVKDELAASHQREAKLQAEVQKLKDAEIRLAKLETKDRMLQIVTILCTAGIVVGGLMTSNNQSWIKTTGYCLATLCAILQAFLGLFNTNRLA